MSSEPAEPEGAAMEKPPIELLETIVTSMLDGEDIGACGWSSTLKRFRKALDATRRENAWDVVALAFGNIVALSFEILVRSQPAMRLRMESLTERRGADLYPKIRDDANGTIDALRPRDKIPRAEGAGRS